MYLYLLAIMLASLFKKKARLWLEGRKKLFKKLRSSFAENEKVAWFHCASLGEFEQARELIESFKKKYPDHKVLLTFFSPSGYLARKNYDKADHVFYLPVDTKANARKFISLVNPKIVFFIKYEYWFNYLAELKRNNIPAFFVSAILRRDQHFFKSYGGWFRKQLKNISYFFVQNELSLHLLNSINISNAMVTGDTRFDRVYRIAQETKEFALIESFKNNDPLLLAGSTWPEDEEIVFQLQSTIPAIKLIIAPHEVHETRVRKLHQKAGEGAILFSEANNNNLKNCKVLIIDSIGMLSHLYRYSDISYIGGGFGAGIHNILEAATFGMPVFFGPNYKKFKEASDLIDLGGAFPINTFNDLKEKITTFIENKSELTQAGNICRCYVAENKGATEKILNHIIKFPDFV